MELQIKCSLKTDGTAAFAGKATSAATVAGDTDTTLVTKGYLEGTGSGTGGGGYVQLKSSTQQDIGTGGLSIAGNTGIGITSPRAKLHVKDDTNYTPSLTYTDASLLNLQYSQVHTSIGISSTSPYTFYVQNKDQSGNARDIALSPLGGSVGIGTTTPGSTLHISSDTQDVLKLTTSASACKLELEDTNTTGANYLQTLGNTLRAVVNGGERVRITDAGYVGIGTTAPGTRLSVLDLSRAIGYSQKTKVEESPSNVDTEQFVGYEANETSSITYSNQDNRMLCATVTPDNTVVWRARNAGLVGTNRVSLHIGNDAKLTVRQNGNVGINTGSPKEKLHVNGTIVSTVGQYASNQSNPYLVVSSAGYKEGADGPWSKIGFQHRLEVSSVGVPRVTINTPSHGEVFCIENSGNVGLGTSVPGTILEAKSEYDTTLSLTTVRDGENYNNAGILFSTPRNNTNDGQTHGGRGMINCLGSSESSAGVLWINAATASLTTASSDEELKAKQCGIRLDSGGNFQHWVNNNPRFSVDSAGNVGIGSATPWTNLHVNSTGTPGDITSARQISVGASENYGVHFGYYQIQPNTNHAGVIQAVDNGGITLALNPSGGNVGIGTVMPIVGLELGVAKNGNQIRLKPSDGNVDLRLNGAYGTADLAALSVVTNHSLAFHTNNIERMRISSDGIIYIGKESDTSNTDGFTMSSSGFLRVVRNDDVPVILHRLDSDGPIMMFRRNDGNVGSISVTTTSTSYNEASDYRLKENIVTISNGIDRIKRLQPRRFNFIAEPSITVDGFIAHEAQEVVPEAVTGKKDQVGKRKVPIYQGIDKSKLVPLLTAALQETIAKVEALEQRLADAGIE